TCTTTSATTAAARCSPGFVGQVEKLRRVGNPPARSPAPVTNRRAGFPSCPTGCRKDLNAEHRAGRLPDDGIGATPRPPPDHNQIRIVLQGSLVHNVSD